jgi:serpin B
MAVNNFNFSILKSINKGGKNLFFSPLSLFYALSMLYEGASGKTREELKNLLASNGDLEKYISTCKETINRLKDSKESGTAVNLANSFWIENGFKVDKKFQRVLRKAYDSQFFQWEKGDLNVIDRINKWVENQTSGKITKLLSREHFKQDTVFVLLNAIYFHDKWKHQFQKENTEFDYFTCSDHQKVKALFMNQTENHRYYEDADFKVLELLYGNESISMVIFLPKNLNKQYDTFDKINTEYFKKALYNVNYEEVKVKLPKFNFTNFLELNELFQFMGLRSAFSPGADFKKICSTDNIYIDDILHKAKIKVEESGTEAAAVTAITGNCMMAAPNLSPGEIKVFEANHPFTFFIVEKEHNTILFSGVISNVKASYKEK